jgi:multidrug efflux pump
MEGMTGRLFREFSIVIAGAVAISSFVALSFTPMLATKMLRPKKSSMENFTSRPKDSLRTLTPGIKTRLTHF